MEPTSLPQERALLVGVEVVREYRRSPHGLHFDTSESLDELDSLARGAGAEVIGRQMQTRKALDAATLVGAGKVEELKTVAGAGQADVVIFDRELTPTQQRNLERALKQRVIDRTQLILDIFARRARTREGQLQVELAQLNYMLPRLAGRGLEMSRLGGGIGTRGPGETQLETDRRKIHRRIRKIEQQLEAVRNTRHVQRRQRQGIPLAGIAMVGYTNAGKSTLFNRLTGAGVFADARMFATLDPTARLLVLPSRRRVVLSDTVGFIRNLPTTLVKAFRATLEEVTEACLLLHVLDVSAAGNEEQTAHVLQVLNEIGASAIPQLLVLNKCDLLSEPVDVEALVSRVRKEAARDNKSREKEDALHVPVCRRAVTVSAHTGEGIAELLSAIDDLLPIDPVISAVFRLPAAAGAEIHLLHEYARITRKEYSEDHCLIEADVPESLMQRLAGYATEG